MSTRAWKETHREDQRAYNKLHYQRHREAAMVRVARRRTRLCRWIIALKTGKRCLYCAETHPACLDFHHRDKESKILEISRMAINGWSEKKILEEINKCDLVCANCHRKYHWNEKQARVAQLD